MDSAYYKKIDKMREGGKMGMQIPTRLDWKQLELCNFDAPFVDPAILSIMQLLLNFQTLS